MQHSHTTLSALLLGLHALLTPVLSTVMLNRSTHKCLGYDTVGMVTKLNNKALFIKHFIKYTVTMRFTFIDKL